MVPFGTGRRKSIKSWYSIVQKPKLCPAPLTMPYSISSSYPKIGLLGLHNKKFVVTCYLSNRSPKVRGLYGLGFRGLGFRVLGVSQRPGKIGARKALNLPHTLEL